MNRLFEVIKEYNEKESKSDQIDVIYVFKENNKKQKIYNTISINDNNNVLDNFKKEIENKDKN
jgi:hypothetical protein